MTAAPECLTGTLGEFSLADVIQLVSMGNKSGKLVLRDPSSGEGYLYFEFGYVVHASLGDLEGEPAARSLLAIEEGTFDFIPGKGAVKKTLMLDGYELLMRAAHKADEKAFLENGGQLVLEIEESRDNAMDQARDRIRELLKARLGRKSEHPEAAVARSDDTFEGLLEACERIERYIAFFIDEGLARETGREMREVIGLL